MKRKYIKKETFLILLLFFWVQYMFAVSLPSNSYISQASITNDESGGGIAQPPSSPILGDAPILPSDPGEVTLGGIFPLCIIALGYLIYKKRKSNQRKPSKKNSLYILDKLWNWLKRPKILNDN